MFMSDEAKVIELERSNDVLTAYNRIPYALLNKEIDAGFSKDLQAELTEICGYYKTYKKGADFATEGSNGDYVAADLRYKMSYSLVNKEARFLFAETPDIIAGAKGNGKATQEIKDALNTINVYLKSVLDKNLFEDALIKAAKDCFIGKRVAGVVNFNEEEGVTVSFLPATQFIYKARGGDTNKLEKFVGFEITVDSKDYRLRRIFKKKYELERVGGKDTVYLEESLYDGAGREVEIITQRQALEIDFIPAVVFVNDGLTGDVNGESEIEVLQGGESWFSKLSNGDIDSGRKNMNPVKYVVDMNPASTKGLKSGPGAFWDLGTDSNTEQPKPMVGLLEASMSYSNPLKATLDRIKASNYELVDMPDISLDTMQGQITSGKALKAIYWSLVVRCKEKMKMWGPKLRVLADIIIKGGYIYSTCIKRYIDGELMPVDYEITVEQNLPLPEDEAEEKQMDLNEVESRTLSRKSYMKKWRGLTDEEAEEELKQIALERQLLEDSSFEGGADGGFGAEGEGDAGFGGGNFGGFEQ